MTQSIGNNYGQFYSEMSKEKKKSNFWYNTAGTVAGMTIAQLASPVKDKLLLPQMANLNNLSQDNIELLHKKANEAIEQNGLKELGVSIKYLEPLSEHEKPKTFMEKLLHQADLFNQVRNGENALFSREELIGTNLITGENVKIAPANTILMPQKELSLQVFHEMGHAMNFNKTALGKVLQKTYPLCIVLSGIPLLYGAFTKKEVAKEGEELSGGQKTKNFVRNNAGKLAFLAMTPVIIEETMASYKGEKIAERMLSKDLVGKLKKSNRFALMSYVGMAALSGLGAYLGIKVKDKLAE